MVPKDLNIAAEIRVWRLDSGPNLQPLLVIFWLFQHFLESGKNVVYYIMLTLYEQPPLFGKERNSLWMETCFFQIHRADGNEVGVTQKRGSK